MEMQIVRTIRFVPDAAVCPRRIEVEVTEDDKVAGIDLNGGCQGCQTLLTALLKGKTVRRALQLGWGMVCGDRKTSCADQVAKALREQFPEVRPTKQELREQRGEGVPPQSGKPWDAAQESELGRLYSEGMPVPEIAELMGRSAWAVAARLIRIGLLSPEAAIAEGLAPKTLRSLTQAKSK